MLNTVQTRRTNKATCDEDAFIDDLTDTSHIGISRNEGLVYRNYLDKPSAHVSPFPQLQYIRRGLTKVTDGLQAFEGILNILKTTSAGSLSCTID